MRRQVCRAFVHLVTVTAHQLVAAERGRQVFQEQTAAATVTDGDLRRKWQPEEEERLPEKGAGEDSIRQRGRSDADMS